MKPQIPQIRRGGVTLPLRALLILISVAACVSQLVGKPTFFVGIQPNLIAVSGRPFESSSNCLSIGIGLHGGARLTREHLAFLARINLQSQDISPGVESPTPPLLDGTYDEKDYEGLCLFSDAHFTGEGEVRVHPFWNTTVHIGIGRVFRIFRNISKDITYVPLGLQVFFQRNNLRFIIGGEERFFHFPYLLVRRTYEEGVLIESQVLGHFSEWRGAVSLNLCIEFAFGR